jgi:hypothetical protein
VNDEVGVVEASIRFVVLREHRRLEPEVQNVASLHSADVRYSTIRRHKGRRRSNEIRPLLQYERRDVSERLSKPSTPVDGKRYAVGTETALGLVANSG